MFFALRRVPHREVWEHNTAVGGVLCFLSVLRPVRFIWPLTWERWRLQVMRVKRQKDVWVGGWGWGGREWDEAFEVVSREMKGDGGTAFEKARRQVLTGGQNETSPYTTRFSFHINVTNLLHLSLLTCSFRRPGCLAPMKNNREGDDNSHRSIEMFHVVMWCPNERQNPSGG